MLYLVIKAALSDVIIAAASEVACRAPMVGLLMLSLPLISVLSLIWIWLGTGETVA